MERVKGKERFYFTVHPLFVLFGVYYACTGKFFLFCTVTVVAVLHEFAHAAAAARVGYRLHKIVLMPYGAIVSGDLSGISFRDEIFVAAAGPLSNLIVALFFAALWWIVPDAYPYTDTAAFASLGVAAINALPAFPLDGGRVLFCAIAKTRGERAAKKICRAVSLAAGGGFVALFAYGCAIGQINLSVLFFAAFIVAGAFAGNRCGYDRIRYDTSRTLERGAEIKRVALSERCKVKKILGYIERGKLLEVAVYSPEGDLLRVLGEEQIVYLLERSNLYSPLSEALKGAERESFEKKAQ